jgi:hypothetical protein
MVRLGVGVVYSHNHVSANGMELGVLADNLVAGRGFMWHFYGSTVPRFCFFPPAYPVYLAALKLAFGGGWVVAMQISQSLAGAATAVAVRRLAASLLEARPAWAAGYAIAAWPPLVVYAFASFSATWEALLVPVIVLWLVRAARSQRWTEAALAGAGYGLLAYALPAFLGSLLLLPAGWRVMGVGWRRALTLTATTLACTLLVLLPWTVRNAAVVHRLVPVATNIGFNYLGGQNAYARYTDNVLCSSDALRWEVIDRQALATMNEADFDRSLLRQGVAFGVAEPLLTVQRCLVRLGMYWFGPITLGGFGASEHVINSALRAVVLPLFVVGLLATTGRNRRRWGLLGAVFVWQSLFYMNFAYRGRYSMPVDSLVLIVAAQGAAVVGGRLWGQRSAAGAVDDPLAGPRPRGGATGAG